MHLNDDPHSLYDRLELTPDATPQEIRSAYLRLKSAYGRDNVAHYGVFSKEETETMLRNVEDAYLVLSNPEKRKLYDQNQGFVQSADTAPTLTQAAPSTVMEARPAPLAQQQNHNSFDPSQSDIDQMIKSETEWSGKSLKKIREARRISLEDLADYTRISKSYLHALEEEKFDKLPAMVYVRGFLQQVSKRLKIPADVVSKSYIDRIKANQPNKA